MLDPLAEPVERLISHTCVPNLFPKRDCEYRLAIVGEAPGETEVQYKQPFCGASGNFLNSILSSIGVDRNSCFLGNICQVQPPGNDISRFGPDHEHVRSGFEQLKRDLDSFQPNCILTLGSFSTQFLCRVSPVSSWRGSILQTPYGKVVPSYHPAFILRGNYNLWFLLRFDAQRAFRQAKFAEHKPTQRTLQLKPSVDEICHTLDNWPTGRILSFDIEGGLDSFPCCSVASASNNGFIIAWSKYSETDQGRIAVALSRALYNVNIPKCLQNSLYDRFVLAYGYNMLIRGVTEDTMLKHWEIYPESSGKKDDETGKATKGSGKSLGVIASIWTEEPYYKFERKADDPEVFYEYCIKDSCVTLEAALAMEPVMSTAMRRHYNFNVALLNPLLYIELKGIKYDKEKAATERSKVEAALAECATRINLRAGSELRGKKGSLSAQRLSKCLYQQKGYPVQKKGRGPAARVSTDVECLLRLQKDRQNDTFLSDILLHRRLEGVLETLSIQCDSDSRIRSTYNPVGTETGRMSCSKSPTGNGANLQTITSKLRSLYRADDSYWFFQCDLSGADGWTVAAHCLRHGDPTMWEDYTAGIKPAKVLALLYEYGPDINSLPRSELLEKCKEVNSKSWLYAACKAVQHGSNYKMKPPTMSTNIMKRSYKDGGKAVYVPIQVCDALQKYYFFRYQGVLRWHTFAERLVLSGANLQSASGHTRVFFGQRTEYNRRSHSKEANQETLREWLADEPQENTTFVTNEALRRLWLDPQNRKDNALIIQPLHQVHDALCGQFPKDLVEWSRERIRSYFDFEIIVADQKIKIPFEGGYGPSWGELTEGQI